MLAKSSKKVGDLDTFDHYLRAIVRCKTRIIELIKPFLKVRMSTLKRENIDLQS